MTKVYAEISTSLDGFVAGPNQTLEEPLGEGGEKLHEWAFRLKIFQEMHGGEGGETGPDDDMYRETVAASGAYVMGRRMFSGGEGRWKDDPNANGWWGEEPPFHKPVFVLTHHEREPLVLGETTFTFVTDGVGSAVEQARVAAVGKDVGVVGGANAIDQAVDAGLVDELLLHVAPVFLGGGARLFDNVEPRDFEQIEAIASPAGVTHLRYRLRRR
jgi:dihydrofolate reductase